MAFQKIQSFCQWQPFFFKTRGWDIVSHLPKECRALQNNSLGHLTWSQWKDTGPIGSFCGGALMLETLCFQRQLNQVESELSVYFVIWGKNENSITKRLKFQRTVQQGWQSRLMGVLKQWFRNLRRLPCTSTASLHPVQLTHSLQTRILEGAEEESSWLRLVLFKLVSERAETLSSIVSSRFFVVVVYFVFLFFREIGNLDSLMKYVNFKILAIDWKLESNVELNKTCLQAPRGWWDTYLPLLLQIPCFKNQTLFFWLQAFISSF